MRRLSSTAPFAPRRTRWSASSPPFRVCTAVTNATVAVPATQSWMHELCVTWAVDPADARAGCVVRRSWAIGHQPLRTSVMDFVEALAGAGACARVSLLDGEEYYVTLQLQWTTPKQDSILGLSWWGKEHHLQGVL